MATAYRPRFVSQFDGSSFASVNCTAAAGAMLLDRQTRGRIRATAADIRARQSDQSGGIDLPAVGAAFRTYGEELTRVTLPTVLALRNALAGGAGAILQGYYGSLPAAYRLQANPNVDHALYIDHVVQSGGGWWYWVMDPLGKGSYQGAYVPESAIRSFGWTAGGQGWLGSGALSSRATAGDEQAAPSGATLEGRTASLRSIVLALQAKGADGFMRRLTESDTFTAARADQWARIVYEMQGGGTNIDATRQTPEGGTFDNLASVRAAADPYVGMKVGLLPTTVIIKVKKPADPVEELLGSLSAGFAEAGRQTAALLVIGALIVGGVYFLARS